MYDVILVDFGKSYQTAIYRGDTCTFIDCNTNIKRDHNLMKDQKGEEAFQFRCLGIYKLCSFLPKNNAKIIQESIQNYQINVMETSAEKAAEKFAKFCVYGVAFTRIKHTKDAWCEIITDGKFICRI